MVVAADYLDHRRFEVRIDGRPPTPNDRYGNRFAQAKVMKQWRDRAREAAARQAIQQGWALEAYQFSIGLRGRGRARAEAFETRYRIMRPMAFARVTVGIIVPDDRRHDWDNGVASLKPLFDGIVDAGLIPDDSTRVLPERTVGFVLMRGLSQVRFEFEEIDPPGSFGL